MNRDELNGAISALEGLGRECCRRIIGDLPHLSGGEINARANDYRAKLAALPPPTGDYCQMCGRTLAEAEKASR